MNELLYIFNTGFYVEYLSKVKGTICLKNFYFKEILVQFRNILLCFFMSIGLNFRLCVAARLFLYHLVIVIFNCFLHHQQIPLHKSRIW